MVQSQSIYQGNSSGLKSINTSNGLSNLKHFSPMSALTHQEKYGARPVNEIVFTVTTSLEGLPMKTKEVPYSQDIKLTLVTINPDFLVSHIIIGDKII